MVTTSEVDMSESTKKTDSIAVRITDPHTIAGSDWVVTDDPAYRSNEFALTDDPGFRNKDGTSPWQGNDIHGLLSGPNAPGMSTADLANVADRVISDFAKAYDVNGDGVFAGNELHDLASAALDQAGKIAPALLANRESVLAAIDRVGSLSAEQLKVLVQDAAAVADTNGNGTIDPQEYQNMIRLPADTSRER